jgi:hypothetical protein
MKPSTCARRSIRDRIPGRPGATQSHHPAVRRRQHDLAWAMKMREFYSLQENVLDRCEDAAKTIEEILIENT